MQFFMTRKISLLMHFNAHSVGFVVSMKFSLLGSLLHVDASVDGPSSKSNFTFYFCFCLISKNHVCAGLWPARNWFKGMSIKSGGLKNVGYQLMLPKLLI